MATGIKNTTQSKAHEKVDSAAEVAHKGVDSAAEVKEKKPRT